ncbi:hypothetical protein YC2023_078628 [Brassica napus]
MYHNSNKNLEISSHKEDLRVESRKVLSITERILNRAKVSGLGYRFPPPPPTSPVFSIFISFSSSPEPPRPPSPELSNSSEEFPDIFKLESEFFSKRD